MTLLLAGLAIATAVSLQRKQNVNPTPSSANYGCNPDGSNNGAICGKDCDGNGSWDVHGKCNNGTCSGAGECPSGGSTGYEYCRHRTEKGLECASQQHEFDVYCKKGVGCNESPGNCEARNVKCIPVSGGTTPTGPTCDRSQAPGCGSGLAGLNTQCGSCTSQGSDQFQGQYTCTSGGWICARSSGVTSVITPTIPPLSEWDLVPGSDCRYEAGGGKCAKASFKGGCDPKVNEMCYCKNEITTITVNGKSYRYGKRTYGALDCGADCSKHPEGGKFSDTTCSNPYRCPSTVSPTPSQGVPTTTPTGSTPTATRPPSGTNPVCNSLTSNQTVYNVGDTPTFTATTTKGSNGSYSYRIHVENTNHATNYYNTFASTMSCAAGSGQCNQTFTLPAGLHLGTGPDYKAYVEVMSGTLPNAATSCVLNFSLGSTSTPTPTTPVNTPTPTSTATPTATPTPTTPPPVCSYITVTPNTNIKQGDTLNVQLTASNPSGNPVKYIIDSNLPGFARQTQTTTNTFQVAVPTSTSISSFNIVGTTTDNNGNFASSPTSCRFTYTFTPLPQVTKTIEPNGAGQSTGLLGTAPNYTVTNSSIVKYDIDVRNAGNNVLDNVVIYDELTAFDPTNANAPVSPAFGDITNATDLTAAKIASGTATSTPNPIAPATPSGNGPYASGTKKVTWTKVAHFQPGEKYTGNITVDILNFTNTPTLRNTVCMYSDVNNNGQYDSGTDRYFICDHKDVFTATPSFTVTKQALDQQMANPVNVVKPGDTFAYKVTFTNTSGSQIDLANVTITDTLDPVFFSKFDITSISNGGTRSNNVITWNPASTGQTNPVPAGETRTYSFLATVKSDFFTGNNNCAEVVTNNVTALSTSPTYSAPTYEVDVTVLNNQCKEEFTITKQANPTVASPGAKITYTSVITNNGSYAAPIVQIEDDYADEFTYVTDTATFTKPDGTTFKKEPTIDAGKMTWTFASGEQVTLSPTQQMTITYQMTASNTTGDYPNTICLMTPAGGCAHATVKITTTPATGLSSKDVVKYMGIFLIGLAGVAYMTVRRKGVRQPAMRSHHAGTLGNQSGTLNDKISDIVSKIKNK